MIFVVAFLETLVREGVPTRIANEAVWRQSKEVRATHAACAKEQHL